MVFAKQCLFNGLQDFFDDSTLYFDGGRVDNNNKADSELGDPDFNIKKIELLIF